MFKLSIYVTLIISVIIHNLVSKTLNINFLPLLFSIFLIASVMLRKERDIIEKKDKVFFTLFLIISFILTRLNPAQILYNFVPNAIFIMVFMFYKITDEVYEKTIKTLNYLSIPICLVAVYQFFIDTSFLNLANKTYYVSDSNALNLPRVTSFLVSYQALSTFCATIIVLNFPKLRNMKSLALVLLNLVALITTFTRNGWVILIIAGFYYFGFLKKIRFRYILFILVIVTSIFYAAFDIISIKERFISTFDVNEGGNTGRIYIYSYYLNKMSLETFAYGEGLGITSQRVADRVSGTYWFSIESQYLKLLFEGGLIYLMLFFAIQIKSFRRSRKLIDNDDRINAVQSILVSYIPLFVFVHILEVWEINFLFWFLTFYIIQKRNKIHTSLS